MKDRKHGPTYSQDDDELEQDDDELEQDDDELEQGDDELEQDDDELEQDDDELEDDELEDDGGDAVRDRGKRPQRGRKPSTGQVAGDAPAVGERAHEVARALGVDDGEGDEGAEGDEVDNRAERRRQRALRRRAARRHGRQQEADKEPQAKDRNARRRQALLEKRRRAASTESDLPADRLLPSEMVDDALARGGAAVIKWVKGNWRVLQWSLVAAVAIGAGYLYWSYRSQAGAQSSADGLAHAVAAEEAVVIAADQDDRTAEQKKADVRLVFSTTAERDKAALAGYRSVEEKYGDTGAAMLAKLGEAGRLLDDRKWDAALAGFDATLHSPLAPADPDVRARALEGKGFAQEGKGDLDGALASFEELGQIHGGGFGVLSKYHQARVLVANGKKDDAKKQLLAARKQLEEVKLQALKDHGTNPYRWLERTINEELTAIDPSTARPQVMPGGGAALPADIRRKLEEKGLVPGKPGR